MSTQKIPGTPTAAGKPRVDAARILLDDKERNCRRFVDAGDNRSALWLRGAPRTVSSAMPLTHAVQPQPRRWADAVADALDEIVGGRCGLYPVDPTESSHTISPVQVSLPHRVLWKEWIDPTRAIKKLQARVGNSVI
ncbi:MAG TPA: hypothetical protein EYN66_00970 [Myxococcales bacterium]|nr:hypothetical protein [Myxococcales bacterium]